MGRSGKAGLAVIERLAELRARRAAWHAAGESLGLVPTMGALHEGHLALLRQARAENDRVAATIFVNPKQFDRAEDMAAYPRTWERDLALLQSEGVDLLYAPRPEEVYPPGFATRVLVGGGLTECLCGRARPGHMEGVATVVAKLFTQTAPERAYFGEKDYQQLLVVRRMARDLDLPLEVVPVPTVRAEDGLALSSRNENLTPESRRSAPLLQGVLSDLAAALSDGRAAAPLLQAARARLETAGFAPIDYLELRCAETLEALDRAPGRPGRPARLFAAAFLPGRDGVPVRLIDNMPVPAVG